MIETYAPEQSFTADVAHMWMICKPIAKPCLKISTHLSHIFQQRLFLNDLLYGQRRSATYWVALVGLPMTKCARPLIHDLHDLLIDQEA